MAHSSILGGSPAPASPSGTGVDALGPSDSSDSGSDIQGERPMATGADNRGELGGVPVDPASDSDALGTGERATAPGDDPRDGADIAPDHIESPDVEPLDRDGATDIEGLADEAPDERDGGPDDARQRGVDVERDAGNGAARTGSRESAAAPALPRVRRVAAGFARRIGAT